MQNSYLNRSTLGARGFFLVRGDRIEWRAKVSLTLTLTLLAAGEREDLWHQGYNRSGFLVKEAPPF